MNNKILASYDTADRRDCVNSGYTYTLYADGRVAATSFARWQGSRTDERFVSPPNYLDVVNIGTNADAEAALVAATRDVDPTQWRQVRRGWIVR
ncbi:MAG: hypothetical protein FJY48_11720 [Betaproteobacteria bacterium]|nr:hypothetical protein [Betaproteobacteria bacterium]